MICQRAYTMLMQEFRGNGIEFARPFAQVHADDKGAGMATPAMRQRQDVATSPGSG